MTPIQKILLAKIKKELPSFKQKRYSFYEEREELTKIVEVQFLNLPENQISFTINYGIYVPALNKILWGSQDSKKISIGDCIFFCNVNDVLKKFNEKPKVRYWKLENLEYLLDEISGVIKDTLYPFSNLVFTLEDLNRLVNTTEFPTKYVASYPILNIVLKYVLGKDDEIKGVIEKLRTKDSKYFDSQIAKMNTALIKAGYNLLD